MLSFGIVLVDLILVCLVLDCLVLFCLELASLVLDSLVLPGLVLLLVGLIVNQLGLVNVFCSFKLNNSTGKSNEYLKPLLGVKLEYISFSIYF